MATRQNTVAIEAMMDPLMLLPKLRNMIAPNKGNDPDIRPLIKASGAFADAAYNVYASVRYPCKIPSNSFRHAPTKMRDVREMKGERFGAWQALFC